MVGLIIQYELSEKESSEEKSEIKSALEKVIDQVISETSLKSVEKSVKDYDVLSEPLNEDFKKDYWKEFQSFKSEIKNSQFEAKNTEQFVSPQDSFVHKEVQYKSKIEQRILEVIDFHKFKQLAPVEKKSASLADQRAYEMYKEIHLVDTMLMYSFIAG